MIKVLLLLLFVISLFFYVCMYAVYDDVFWLIAFCHFCWFNVWHMELFLVVFIALCLEHVTLHT